MQCPRQKQRTHLSLLVALASTTSAVGLGSCTNEASFSGPTKVATASQNSATARVTPTGSISTASVEPASVTLTSAATEVESKFDPIVITATFSKPVTGLTPDLFAVTNGTITNLNTVAPDTYTFTFTPTAPGPYSVKLPATEVGSNGGIGNKESNPIEGSHSYRQSNASLQLTTSQTQNSIWVVTKEGTGAKIVLDAANKYPMTKFIGAGVGKLSNGGISGHRTFVSQYGLFIGTTNGSLGVNATPDGGKIFFMPKNFTEGSSAQLAANLNTLGANTSIGADMRICVMVYSLNGQEYLGAAYNGGASNSALFYSAPIDSSKPGFVDTTKAKVLKPDISGSWGYSCYFDAKRNYFYSRFGNTVGVDLNTGADTGILKTIAAPNSGFSMKGPGGMLFDLISANQSYAIAGSTEGSLLSAGPGVYTMAAEPVSGTAIVSTYTARSLFVMSDKCFKSIPDCSEAKDSGKADVAAYDTSGVGYIGPLSSLNDGRVIGLQRGAKSKVFLIALVDPKDITKGLKIDLIQDNIDGDLYMYTDFTGSANVAKGSVQNFDLTQASEFKAGSTFKTLKLSWEAASGSNPAWVGLNLSVACFKKGDTDIKSGPIANVPSAGIDFDISQAPGCKGIFDQIQISVQPTDANTLIFSKTSNFKLAGQQ